MLADGMRFHSDLADDAEAARLAGLGTKHAIVG
jgi:hypothetical protein